ncbi:MAG TPA: response regulator [Cytophagales bacterium]|nr:response regulator [Cytophagales bacterium]
MKKLHTIILLDDDEVTNTINESVILSLNVCENLLTFPNAIQGLSYFNRIQSIDDIPELVLVDLKMPIIDGFEFKKAFEHSFSILKNKVKMIVVTSSDRLEDREIAVQLGFDDYYVKPLTHQKFQDLIIKHFPDALTKSA